MKLREAIKPIKRFELQDKVKFGLACEVGEWVQLREYIELEEKYLELLKVLTHSLDSLYDAHLRADVMNMPDLNIQEVQEVLERHTGLTYEEIKELEL